MPSQYGSAVAQTYLIPPTQAPQQAVGRPQQPFTDEIGSPEENLQQIDGVTNDYFQKWAQLKGFARDVHENLGIDVRFPDPSIPESSRLHQIYLKAIADLKAQGERLKTGQKMFEADRQRGAIVNIDPRKQYYDQANVGTDIVDKQLDPVVTEANDKLKGLYFGKAINEAKAYYSQVKSRLEQLRDSQPNQAGYWQHQIDALVQPTQSVREFQDRAPRVDNNRGKINSSGNFLRKNTNLLNGLSDSYNLSDETFGPNKERVWTSTEYQGDKYGNEEIVRFEHTPSTKQTFMVVKDKEGNTRKLNVTGTDPISFSKGLTSENARHSASGEYIDQFADEQGLLNPDGSLNTEPLVREDAESRQKQIAKLENKDNTTKYYQDVEGELDRMEAGAFGGDTITYPIKDGKTVEIYRGNKGYYIENAEELFPGDKVAQKQYKDTPMTRDQISKFLFKSGLHKAQLQKQKTRKSSIAFPAPTGTNVAPANQGFDPTKF